MFQTDFDVWGLVVNEAMAAGVSVLASTNAGATHDLIIDGVTGFAVDYNNQAAVLEKINLILDNSELTGRMGRNAEEIVATRANIAVSARGFFDSVMKG